MQDQESCTEYGQYSTCDKTNGTVAHPVCEPGRNPAGQSGNDYTKKKDGPLFQKNGRMDQDMADGRNQSGKGHDECTGAHGCLQFHAETDCEHNQHHHAAARSNKPGAEPDGQPEKQGPGECFPVQFFTAGCMPLLACIRFDEKTDPDAEGQEQSKCTQNHISDKECNIAADGTHGQDTDHHDPAALQIHIPMSGIGPCCYCRAQNIGCKCDGGCLIGSGFTGERRAQDDEDGNHDCCRRKTGKACPDSCTQSCNDVPYVFCHDRLTSRSGKPGV